MVLRSFAPRRLVGMTLIELLVVIAIVAVLIGLLLSATQKVRGAAARAACRNNLKQIALAAHAYHDAHNSLPVNSFTGSGSQSRSWSWLARLLPYLEHDNLYRQGNIPTNTLYQGREVAGSTVKVFLCPSDTALGSGPRPNAADLGEYGGPTFPPSIAAGQTNYKGVSGANWAWGEERWRNRGINGSQNGLDYGDGIFTRGAPVTPRRLTGITDGTSSTFMVGEDVPAKNYWCSWPYANNAIGTCAIAPNAKRADGNEYPPGDWFNVYSFRSRHPGGLHFVYADGSVHFINDTIDLAIYRAMATIQGGEVVNVPH